MSSATSSITLTCRDAGAIVRDGIVGDSASIPNVVLTGSLVGSNANHRGAARRIHVGDTSEGYVA